jgi:regulator of sigma E protease
MVAALGAAQTALWGIITFSILVVLHELGHFLAARAFGVRVHEFMVGLPGPALRLHTKKMDWGVTAVPLGGYVRIAGMEPGEEDELLGPALVAVRDAASPLDAAGLGRALGVDNERAETIAASLKEWKAVKADTDDRLTLSVDGDTTGLTADELLDRARTVTYRGQSTLRRITILAMGVVTNLALAILTFTVFFSVFGYFQLTTTIDTVGDGSPAAKAGIQAGDRLVAVDGQRFEDWDRFQMIMARTKAGQTTTITVVRDGATKDIPVTLANRDGHGFLGVSPTGKEVHPNVIQSLGQSLRYVWLVFQTILDLFNPGTFSGTIKNFTGVVGVSVMAEQAAKAGALSYASLIAMLSLSLGIMNMLPLPPLDGGKIVLEIVEGIIGRPLSRNVTLGFSAVGAVMLFSLIGYIMYLDIMRFAL